MDAPLYSVVIRRTWALLLAATLVAAGCGSDAEGPETAEAPITETVDLDRVPIVPPQTPPPTPTPAAAQEPPLSPLPELRVWPISDPAEWPRTPDEAASGFAQHVARGERAAVPNPALQDGTTATAQLPGVAEDGTLFGAATTIQMQQVQLDDGSVAWVVISAQSDEIVVESPAVGELLAGGIIIEGEGQGFEGTIIFEVEDQDGLLGQALAQGGALGENLPFETQLPFDERPASGNWAILTGYTASAADGSLSALTMIPMHLVDGS